MNEPRQGASYASTYDNRLGFFHGGNMKRIPLTQGYEALVDDEDYEELVQYTWYPIIRPLTVYAMRWEPRTKDSKRKGVYMHRQILQVVGRMQGDHIDHDGLNNQRANLRRCTQSQNMGNRQKQAGCSSKHKGVSWDKQAGSWRAAIGFPVRYLGLFKDEPDAARAYNAEARILFGEYALLNNVRESIMTS